MNVDKPDSPSPALTLTDVNLTLRERTILEDINFTLEEGEFLGLIGPNGAGKTVLLKVILGLITPDRGAIKIFGHSPHDAHGLVGYVPQYGRFDPDFPISVFEAVLSARTRKTRWPFPYSAHDREIAMKALQEVELADLSSHQLGRLSGGQLQRVLIARALAVEPRILLLDEPTASLDSRVGKTVYHLLEELSSRLTIVLVSHDIGAISSHVKTIACLNRRLHYHHSKELSRQIVEEVYGCPIDLIAHGHSHRVLNDHDH